MNRRSFVMTGVAALVSSPAAVRAQGLVICRQCGREAKPGESVCSHCGAALAKPRVAEAAAPVVTAPDKGAEVVRMALSVISGSLRQARELEEKQPEVALWYYRNALALMRLVPAGTQPAGIGPSIVEGDGRTLQTLLRGRIPCRTCNGTGKFQLDVGKVNHTKSIKAVEGIPCPDCKGVGSFPGYRDIGKVKMAILQGRGEFQQRQMVAGDVRVGQALVPSALDALLTNRQRALVMTGMPAPCTSCQLTGRQKCTVCKGSSWVKCNYPGCTNGELKETAKTKAHQAIRMNEEEKKNKCPRCEGRGEIPCETCKGSGSVACKTCDGSGLAPRCSRCTGTGLMVCSKCKGTGAVKGSPCPDCKGEAEVLCTTCRGEGALAR